MGRLLEASVAENTAWRKQRKGNAYQQFSRSLLVNRLIWVFKQGTIIQGLNLDALT